MHRLREENINTPEHFNEIWVEGIHYFDRVRMEAFTDYVKNGQTVLDVGAGLFSWGEYLLSQRRSVTVYAVDFSPTAQEIAQQRFPSINYVLSDIAKGLPWADGYFDVVGSGEVIEHMEEPDKFAEEMARVCCSDGMIIIGTVDTESEDAKKIIYPEHVWEFTSEDLIDLLSPYGKTRYKVVGNYHFVYCHKS